MKNVPYRNALGALSFAVCVCRPDMAFAVSLLSSFMSNPGREHWKALQHVFAYKGTSSYALEYGNSPPPPSGSPPPPLLSGFSDSDYAGDDNAHSTNGYVFKVGRSSVSWSSKKQTVVARSTTESEYIGGNHAGAEAIWLRNLTAKMGFPSIGPTHFCVDNQAAISVSKAPQHFS